MEIGILKIWCCFKIRILKLKIGICTPNSCPTTWGAIVGSGNWLEGFFTLFPPFNPSLNFLKFLLNSYLPLANSEPGGFYAPVVLANPGQPLASRTTDLNTWTLWKVHISKFRSRTTDVISTVLRIPYKKSWENIYSLWEHPIFSAGWKKNREKAVFTE